jgi:F0F1-type ATP synthase membrane subunit c/vacuolar-type H+-ATPase subunit K
VAKKHRELQALVVGEFAPACFLHVAAEMTTTPPLRTPPTPTPTGDRRDSSADRAPSPWRKRWVPIAIAIASALAAIGAAYGVGRAQGALALREAEQQRAEARSVWQTQLASCETARSLLEARRSLALVALSLDRRNFGVAEGHRQRALGVFASPSLSGVAGLPQLADEVRGLNLAVDPDPGTKREKVISLSEALDQLVTERTSESSPVAKTATTEP